LAKSFGPVHALRDVTLDLESGSGKSTFISVVSGAAGPTGGRVEVFGELAEITSPRKGAKLGIQVVHQEPKLTNEASIAENIVLTILEGTRCGWSGHGCSSGVPVRSSTGSGWPPGCRPSPQWSAG
jgi:ribose transport system ATP-binding protein